ncbi:hypothetical protein EZV73_20035 [Acidaminobacter sp. JC074]|uniref:peptide ABC transporter substrate-binding protein n=1 Tax=Acidaminobacter sp. JC074 TaxID=2530199 RepID=UPI001F109DE6|nr:ABC transporter substrate-binding protein [Acidaminobacter sp. JC074]MCH4889880.1 hypothetical protein [Acidaminobacter sp. JC074]
MKKIFVVMFIILSLLCLSSCNEEKHVSPVTKEKTVLYWATDTQPRFFYPSMHLSDVEKQIINQMYEGLTLTYDGLVRMGMARTIDISGDELVYEIELKNAQWSDGRMVTVDDFLYSWERKENYIDDVNLLYFDAMIHSVEKIDDLHMRIILNHTNEDLLKQLSTVAFMPLRSDVIDLDLPIPILLSDVTNGAYTLDSYMYSSGAVLSKNVHYYDFYNVSVDEIHYSFRTDDRKVYSEYISGEIDIVQNINYSQFSALMENQPDFQILSKPGVYSFNMNPEELPLKDIKVRQLLNLSVDRSTVNPYSDLLVDSVAYSIFDEKTLERLKSISTSEVEYMGEMYSMNPKKPYIDADKVESLLDEIDTSLIEQLNGLTIVTTKSTNDIQIANTLAESWKNTLGIYVRVDSKDYFDYAYILKSGTYDIILDKHYYSEYSPRHMLKYFFSDTCLNNTMFASDQFNHNLLKTIIYNDTSLHKLYESAIKDVDDVSLMIPLFNTQEPVLINPDLKSWSRSYEGLFNFTRVRKEES